MDKDYTRTPSGLLKEGLLIILVESMSSFLIIELEVDWRRTGQGVQKTHLAGQSTHNPSPVLEQSRPSPARILMESWWSPWSPGGVRGVLVESVESWWSPWSPGGVRGVLVESVESWWSPWSPC